MLKPRALKPGSRIAVLAPASSFTREEFDAGIAEISRLGFVPVYDDSVFAKGIPPYVAGSAELRAGALKAALSDTSIDGIIAVRGGYGSAQVLPFLDSDEVRRAAKPFIGQKAATTARRATPPQIMLKRCFFTISIMTPGEVSLVVGSIH